MNYRKIVVESGEGNSTIWGPKTAEIGEALEGQLVEKKSEVGANKSWIYTLVNEASNRVAVWGTTVLDNKMAQVEVGNKIKIVYLGTKKSSKGRSAYHDFDVYVAEE